MLFASWILIKLDMNGEEGLGTNPIQWCHDDVITDFTVGWLQTKNLVYWLIYFIYMQVYAFSLQNIADGLRCPERLWLNVRDITLVLVKIFGFCKILGDYIGHKLQKMQ